ncbi:MAG: NADH-quinone oxidoreductase subunit NuoE [Candidatus Hermodarchaeota archaeon]
MVEIDKGLLRDILSRYQGKANELIPILLEVQENFSYLPEEAIRSIADYINIPEGNIYSVSSFYSQFRLTPIGRQHITVCRGTACHVRGAPQILSEIENEIGIAEGETSDDLEYSLESVACIGCCALAPCLKVNNNVHGDMTAQKVDELFTADAAS